MSWTRGETSFEVKLTDEEIQNVVSWYRDNTVEGKTRNWPDQPYAQILKDDGKVSEKVYLPPSVFDPIKDRYLSDLLSQPTAPAVEPTEYEEIIQNLLAGVTPELVEEQQESGKPRWEIRTPELLHKQAVKAIANAIARIHMAEQIRTFERIATAETEEDKSSLPDSWESKPDQVEDDDDPNSAPVARKAPEVEVKPKIGRKLSLAFCLILMSLIVGVFLTGDGNLGPTSSLNSGLKPTQVIIPTSTASLPPTPLPSATPAFIPTGSSTPSSGPNFGSQGPKFK